MSNIEKILQKIRESFNNLSNNKLIIIFIILWLCITIVIMYYVYKFHINPIINNHKLNKEFGNKNTDNSNDILIMYFYTDWCPYCKKAKPEWNKFETYINNINKTSDYNIDLVSINCDEKKSIADKYNIEGYPSVKLITGNKVYDFDAKVTKDNLIEFFNSIK